MVKMRKTTSVRSPLVHVRLAGMMEPIPQDRCGRVGIAVRSGTDTGPDGLRALLQTTVPSQ
jgi:hypothetical protein